MSNPVIYEELDQAIELMLSTPETELIHRGTDVDPLMELAGELRLLPRANFKQRLQIELEWEAAGRAVSAVAAQQAINPAKVATSGSGQVLPSLFGKTWTGYPVRRMDFAVSVALHGMMVVLIRAGFLIV